MSLFDKDFSAKSIKNFILISLTALSLILYLSFYMHFTHPIRTFAIVSVFSSVIFLFICALIKRNEYEKKYVYFFIIAGVVFRLALLSVYPTASDDIYRYVWDGKVQAAGINPYRYAPEDSALNKLNTNTLPALINHSYMKTIYPPFSQFMFLASYAVFGESVYGIKILLFIAEIITIFLLMMLLRKLKLPEKNIAYYSLCPLPVMQFIIDGHIDAAGFPLLLLVILLFAQNKKIYSFLILGLSVASKFITGMILPFLFKEVKGWKKALIIFPFIILVITYIPYFSRDVNLFEALFEFTANWYSNGSVFSVIFPIVKNNQDARLICAALFLLSGVALYFIKIEWYRKIYFIFFLFLLFSPTVHPWYVTWLAVLLPISFRWSGAVFIAAVSLANIPLVNYVLRGIWTMPDSILLLEYIPVFVIFWYESYSEYLLRKEEAIT